MQKLSLALIAIVSVLLSACANVEFDEIASAGAATAGCAAGFVLTGTPAGCVAVGAPAATTTIVVTEKSDPVQVQDFRGEDGELSFVEAAAFAWAEFSSHLIGLAVIFAAFLLLSTYLGMRKRRPEEKALEKQVGLLVDKIGRMKDG